MSQNPSPPESLDLNAIYQDVKERVEKRFQWRAELGGHIIGYIGFLFVGTLFFSENSGIRSTEVYPIIALIWLGGLMIHVMNVMMFELRERALQRELENAGIYPGMIQREKAKHNTQFGGNERLVRLTEDGELVDVNQYENEDSPRQGASS